MHLTLEDRRFTITSNRAIVAVTPVSVAPGGRTFSVWARDNSGLESEMVVHLVHSAIRQKKVRLCMLVTVYSRLNMSEVPFLV